mmetsp:Transcript_31231/g.38585  ORF Transcript_31231/g.38585 Transcript_31231/m.38585 type:complete len:129 (+) Transcript_31231:513-899(+)
MAKQVDSFAQLSEVRQKSDSPASDYCVCERLFLSSQPDWEWLDMINTFYHGGAKQSCEHQPWHNPVHEVSDHAELSRQNPASDAAMADPEGVDVEMEADNANVITDSAPKTSKSERASLTLTSINMIG